jgi:hypothetical protein
LYEDAQAADLLQECEAKIAALERMVARLIRTRGAWLSVTALTLARSLRQIAAALLEPEEALSAYPPFHIYIESYHKSSI